MALVQHDREKKILAYFSPGEFSLCDYVAHTELDTDRFHII